LILFIDISWIELVIVDSRRKEIENKNIFFNIYIYIYNKCVLILFIKI
jgi:hypothetical protein